MNKIISFCIASAALFSSCEKIINPDELKLKNTDPKLIIEGYITNQPGPYQVKITQSVSYFSNNPYPIIDNAFVTLSDNTGQADTLLYQGNGVYATNSFTGIQGRFYYLTVTVNGKVYTAESLMLPMVSIDALTYGFKEASPHYKAGYFPTLKAQDDPAYTNYYLIRGFKNGQEQRRPEDSVLNFVVLIDYTFNGNQLNRELTFRYDIADTAAVELYTLDYNGYQFYLTLQQQLTSGASPFFSTQPGNIKTNITNGATGYFGAHTISKKQVVIQ